MLVEDEPLTAEVFAKALERDGHVVDVARDGLQALRRLRDQPPSVVVLDLSLPTVSGAQVVDELRRSDLRHLPIVVVSGSDPSESSVASDAVQPGAWLTKPVKPSVLVRIVDELLQAR